MKKGIAIFLFLAMLTFLLCENVSAQSSDDGWLVWIDQTIILGLMPLLSIQGSKEVQLASLNISGEIDAQAPLGKLFLSQNLSLAIKKCTFSSPREMARIYSDKIVYSLGQDWIAPFNIEIEGKKQPPQVSFKNGEIVWHKNKKPGFRLSIKEGTLSKIREVLYIYKNGKWQLK